jgi:SulP family sulfate permease
MSGTSVLFVTLLLTVFFDLTLAIEVGLVMAIAMFMKRAMESAHISVVRDEMGVHNDGEKDEVLTIPANAEVFEIEGPFFFGIANKFDELTRNTDARPIRIIRMRRVNFIDATGIHNLEIFIESAQKEGQIIILSGVNEDVYKALLQSGIVAMVGEENVLDHISKALARAEQLSKNI